MKLTPKQKAFADEYLKNGGNAAEAYRKAGYRKKGSNANAARLIANDSILNYIAERQQEIEKQAGRDIMSLTEIQERRSKLAKGELKDDFGFSPDFSDQLKAMNDLEKALTIKEEKEAEKKALEDARQVGTYHIDLDVVADVFHPMIRDIRNGKHSEYVLPGGRGSTKSSGISLIIPELMKNNPLVHALILRKVGNTIKDIIRKHMNDGWIPVEERLPEDEIPVPKLVTALVPDRKARWDNSETFSMIVDTDIYDPDYTGKWEYYKKNVIAWRPLPEPYRPEGSDCDGK